MDLENSARACSEAHVVEGALTLKIPCPQRREDSATESGGSFGPA